MFFKGFEACNFWYEGCSYGLLLENHTLYAGKILIWQNFGLLNQNLAIFAIIDSFESF